MAGSKLRELIRRGETIVAPGCHDPLSAKTIQYVGFEAAHIGDFAVGATLACSMPLVTATEMADFVSRITMGIDIPLVADAGPGYGDPANVARTAECYEHAGAAAMHIEDGVYPRTQASGVAYVAVETVPEEIYAKRITAAVSAKKDPDFLIIGRTEAFVSVGGGKEEAVRRAKVALNAGAGMIFVRGTNSPESVQYFREALPDVPLMAVAYGDIPLDLYRDLGYQLVAYPTMSVTAGFLGVLRATRELKETGRLDHLTENGLAYRSSGEFAKVLGTRRWELLEGLDRQELTTSR